MLFYGEFLENKRPIIYGRQLTVITKKKWGQIYPVDFESQYLV
jgi:hypothetical protein